MSRIEEQLDVLMGMPGAEAPEPESRIEEKIDYIIEHGGGGGGGSDLPTIHAGDEGKVLTVSDEDEAVWAEIANELPDYSSLDEGKILAIVDGSLAWVNPPSGGGLGFAQSGEVIEPVTGEYEEEEGR